MSQNSENSKIVHQKTTLKTVYVKNNAIFWCIIIRLNNNLVLIKLIYNQIVNVIYIKSIKNFSNNSEIQSSLPDISFVF